jgi:tetratricopeptide (TPR) repeat protein
MRARLPETRTGVLVWLTLAILVCYANALNSGFQFDDFNVIVNNPRAHSWSSWMEGLTLGIRPLLKFSYTLNWTMGMGVIGFHVTNMLIHLMNAYLVYLLAKEFVGQQFRAEALRDIPLFVALLFAVHPIHTEAVTYICGRSISLMTLFYLMGLFTYINGRIQKSSVKVYGLTPLFFVVSLSVKETAVTFPLALLLWEYVCGGKWQRALKPQWPNWLVLILGSLTFLFSDSYLSQMERSAQLNSLQGNAATQLSGFAYLMRQWALPLWLNIDPDLPMQHDISAGLLPLAFFVALLALMFACWQSRPWISFALAWAMLQLIPLHLFLPRIDIANDRQMYLAGWPLFLAVCIEFRLWSDETRTQIFPALLLLGLAFLTVLRNQDYASEISLWEDTAMKSPGKARVHNNLGYAYLLAQRHAEARREFTTALQLDPRLYKARYNLYRLDDEASSTGEKIENSSSGH